MKKYKIEVHVTTSIDPLRWICDAIEPCLDLDAGEEITYYAVEEYDRQST